MQLQVNQNVRFYSKGHKAMYFYGVVRQVLRAGYAMVEDQTGRPPRIVSIDRLEIIQNRFAGTAGRL